MMFFGSSYLADTLTPLMLPSIRSRSRHIPRIRALVGICDWPMHMCCAPKAWILERTRHPRCVNKRV